MKSPSFLRFQRGSDLGRSSTPVDLRVLLGCLGVLVGLCAYRFYDFWSTGFFVSDEFGYYFEALHTQIYGDRWFFGWLNIYLFRALGITNVDAFSYLLPFYMFFWCAATLIIFYHLLRVLGFDDKTRAVSLLSSFVLVSFVLLSLGFLTEPVGLALGMGGIYCVLRCVKSRSRNGLVGFPILAAASFGAASGTREPYEAFLIGGVAVFALMAFMRRNEHDEPSGRPLRSLLAASVVIFAVLSVFFLTVPAHSYQTQVAPITAQFAQSLISNPATVKPAAVTTTVAVSVVTTVTQVTTTTINSTVITTTLVHTSTTSSLTTGTGTPSIPFYRESLLLNTVIIFLGGVALGWGPICFFIGLSGFVILLMGVRRSRNLTSMSVLLSSLIALGSYFIVSFIFAPDPYYFSFQNYSTIIRFSDTALPAYFMMAPFFLALVCKTRRRTMALLAVFLIFLVVAVPVYEVYAASNIHYTSANPFGLGYRTDAVVLRDYLQRQGVSGKLNLVGEPYGWAFTPGVQDLHVSAYAIGTSPLFPELSVANFTSFHWTSFYLCIPSTESVPTNSSGLLDLIGRDQVANSTLASTFDISSTHLVIPGGDFHVYEVGLSW